MEKMVRILVIEDDESLRENIADILKLEDYEVLTAQNGDMGVQVARDSLPDLIFCDVMMPQLDGYGVFQALQQDTATAVIPIVFLTARADGGSTQRAMEQG